MELTGAIDREADVMKEAVMATLIAFAKLNNERTDAEATRNALLDVAFVSGALLRQCEGYEMPEQIEIKLRGIIEKYSHFSEEFKR